MHRLAGAITFAVSLIIAMPVSAQPPYPSPSMSGASDAATDALNRQELNRLTTESDARTNPGATSSYGPRGYQKGYYYLYYSYPHTVYPYPYFGIIFPFYFSYPYPYYDPFYP